MDSSNERFGRGLWSRSDRNTAMCSTRSRSRSAMTLRGLRAAIAATDLAIACPGCQLVAGWWNRARS